MLSKFAFFILYEDEGACSVRGSEKYLLKDRNHQENRYLGKRDVDDRRILKCNLQKCWIKNLAAKIMEWR
jgi:hypothetical protein